MAMGTACYGMVTAFTSVRTVPLCAMPSPAPSTSVCLQPCHKPFSITYQAGDAFKSKFIHDGKTLRHLQTPSSQVHHHLLVILCVLVTLEKRSLGDTHIAPGPAGLCCEATGKRTKDRTRLGLAHVPVLQGACEHFLCRDAACQQLTSLCSHPND